MKTDIMNNLTRTFNKVGWQIKKHSPEILLVTGVVGTVASTVLACKATTKASSVLENAKTKIDAIHEVAENPDYAEEYTPEDKKKDLTIAYTQTALDFVKLYGPSVLLGAASITCILASHNIIRKRNVALSAAYAAVTNNFKEYKGRVIERFGEELDRELTYNIKAKEVEEVVVNEDGTTSVEKKTINVVDGPVLSEHALCFDDTCLNWTRNAEDNKFFLMGVEAMLNDRLKSQGIVTMNELREAIGLPLTRKGANIGWVYDKNNEIGDNYIDLGIFNIRSEANRNFVNGFEQSVWLDPNVDGEIYTLLK